MGHLGRNIRYWHSFLFDPRKGQDQAELDQISKFKIFLQTRLSYPVLSRDSKNDIHCYVQQLEISKIAFQNRTSSPSSVSFLPLQSQKREY